MPDDIEYQAAVEELNRLRAEVEFLRPHVKGLAKAADHERDSKKFYETHSKRLVEAVKQAIVYLETHGPGLSDEQAQTLRSELNAVLEKPRP